MKRIMLCVALAVLAVGCSSEAAVPAECDEATPGETSALDNRLKAVEAPDGVQVFATQVISSTNIPDSNDVVVRLCGPSLDEAELRAVATDMAAAADESGLKIDVFKVSSWVPEDGSVAQEQSATVDAFWLSLWDGKADGINLDDVWEIQP